MEVFKTRVRNVGTSLGILIPKEIIVEGKLKLGEDIKVSVFKQDPKRLKILKESLSIDKGKKLKKFIRDTSDRMERLEHAS